MKKNEPTILLVRHGHRTSDPGFDTLLTEPGVRQAKELVTHLDTMTSNGIKYIYSSPYLRCLETAQPLSENQRIGICVDDRLSECFAEEGTDLYPSPRHLTTAEVSTFNVVQENYKGVSRLETWNDLKRRTASFLQMCMDRHSTDETIVIVTHMSTLNACLSYGGHDVEFNTPFPMGGIIPLYA